MIFTLVFFGMGKPGLRLRLRTSLNKFSKKQPSPNLIAKLNFRTHRIRSHRSKLPNTTLQKLIYKIILSSSPPPHILLKTLTTAFFRNIHHSELAEEIKRRKIDFFIFDCHVTTGDHVTVRPPSFFSSSFFFLPFPSDVPFFPWGPWDPNGRSRRRFHPSTK